VFRLGVVSEHTSNSSPGLCIYAILKELAQAVDIGMTGILELVYFDRNSFSTATAEEMRRSSREVVFMDFDNLETTKERILSQKLDALLYLALPTEKFTVLLSQARLAPIQIQYGVSNLWYRTVFQ